MDRSRKRKHDNDQPTDRSRPKGGPTTSTAAPETWSEGIMDQNPRGRGRNNQLRQPGAQRPTGPQSGPPGIQRPNGPRPGPPRQPGFTPRQAAPYNPRAPGPSMSQNSQAVEQVSRAVSTLSTADRPIPVGRGVVRGSRVLEPIEYFRQPKPMSVESGKQGTMGQPIELTANYFPVDSYAGWALYQYRVDFSPQEDRIGVKRGLLGTHRATLGGFLFDGTMLFSSIHFATDPLVLTSKRDSDDELMTITVSFTRIVEPNDYANIQVFNLILRNSERYMNLVLVGRNYYDPQAKVELRNQRLQLWPGYETTIGMFDSGLLLRAEISTKVMRDETVLDFLRECMRNRNGNFMDQFKAGVIGTVVLTRYNNQTYRINDIDENSSPSSTFKKKDGSSMSYIEYYKSKWGVTIRDGRQPMLISKKKMPIGSRTDDKEQLIYLVPELCSLTGITQAMRENFNLMRELAEQTRVAPRERVIRYNNFMNRLQSTPESLRSLTEWNLKLNNNLVKLKGRILPMQGVFCNTTKYDAGPEADWTRQLVRLPMFTCALLPRWAIIYPGQNENEVKAFVNTLRQVANGMSFNIPVPESCPINAGNIRGYQDALEKAICQLNPSFILCVTQSTRPDVYNIIKRFLCVTRAVPSQVVALRNVQKNNMSVATKIAIQINCKLGGAPWKIAIPTPGIMIVGFDVCHDKQNKNRSYGALIASLNDSHTKYYSDVRPHPSGQELSANFAISIGGALHAYKKLNGNLPKQIIIYRDGVGDGQVSYVHQTEVAMIKGACKELYGGEVPPMAFIIVKKRISTRFFSSSGNQGHSNPPPGTVVDSVITDPTMYDFFLVSQHVRFGTVTPTHYNVIVDTLNEWNPNKMQLLTYKLTHMYYNWSGTVRVPAPCQLAHKLAFLTAQSLGSTPNVALNELLYFL